MLVPRDGWRTNVRIDINVISFARNDVQFDAERPRFLFQNRKQALLCLLLSVPVARPRL